MRHASDFDLLDEVVMALDDSCGQEQLAQVDIRPDNGTHAWYHVLETHM